MCECYTECLFASEFQDCCVCKTKYRPYAEALGDPNICKICDKIMEDYVRRNY